MGTGRCHGPPPATSEDRRQDCQAGGLIPEHRCTEATALILGTSCAAMLGAVNLNFHCRANPRIVSASQEVYAIHGNTRSFASWLYEHKQSSGMSKHAHEKNVAAQIVICRDSPRTGRHLNALHPHQILIR